ncbi:MAG: prepilin-type N-terminal cleavage/methylation domain-containing protein, partial [Lachnospiraceae bacterium]|nr:prepilin-type N-terminal cleavage/methylation domain-containing protein [Lachnospiraceae bacterium]
MMKYAEQYRYIRNRKGFTMVELIVVLAILSILSSVA